MRVRRRCRSSRIGIRSRSSRRGVPIIRSQCACVGFRGLWRTLEAAQARVGEYRVEGFGELAGTVADQELDVRRVGVHEEVAGSLGGPFARGVGRYTKQVGTTAAVFQQDQGVDAFAAMMCSACAVRNCFHVGPLRCGAGSIPAWLRMFHTVETGDLVSEAGQFAVDPPVTPGGIVGGRAQHQSLDRSSGGRSPGTTPPAVVPSARHELAMPGQQGSWGDREDLRPATPGYQGRERRQPQAIGGLIAHPSDLTGQNRVLVPEYQQFRLLGDVTAKQQRGQRQQTSSDGVHRGQEHKR